MAKRVRAPKARKRPRAAARKSKTRAAARKTKKRVSARKTSTPPPTPNPSPQEPAPGRAQARPGWGGEECAARLEQAHKKRGPKPGTRSRRKFAYTPELLADCRYRIEQTDESIVSIARDYGVGEKAIRNLMKDEGWTKFPTEQRDLPAAVKLRRRAAALVEMAAASTPFVPAQAGTQFLTAEQAAPGSPLARGRADEGAPPAQEPHAQLPAIIAAGIAEALGDVQNLLAEVRSLRAAKTPPRTVLDLQRLAQTYATLNGALRDLVSAQEKLAPRDQQPSNEGTTDDDLPADPDAFRDELARRIRAFVAGRRSRGDAGADAAAPVDAVQP